MKAGRQKGFTLIELVIAVVIVGILAAIAMPAYQEYVKRGNRGAAQSEMMDIANREQQFLLANRAYADKTALEASGYAPPSGVASKYSYAISLDDPAVGPVPNFQITFNPSGSQTSDGALVLNSAGVKTRAGDATKW